MAKKKYQNFEIMTMQPESLIEALKNEIKKKDYDLDYIKDLVTYGHFDINELFEYPKRADRNALILASELNKLDIVKLLLENGADPNVQDEYGSTSLHWASNKQVVQVLLEHPKTNPNIIDNSGKNPIMCALDSNDFDLVKALLQHPKIDRVIETDEYYDYIEDEDVWEMSYYYDLRKEIIKNTDKHIKEIKMLKSLLKEISAELPENSKSLKKIKKLSA